jgi:hypothetical protein
MRCVLLLASVAAVVLVTASIAFAGTWTIANCPAAPGGGGNPGPWTVFGAPQNYKGNCSGGPGDFIGPLGGFMAPATIDGVQVSVPGGSAITIRGARVWWYVPQQLSGATTFAIAAVNTGAVEEAATPKVSIGAPDEWSLPSDTTELTLADYCSNDDAGGGCTFGGGENPDLELLGAQLTLADSNLPSGSVTGGALAGNGSISGTAAVAFTAHDGESGVRALNLLVDGRVVATRDYIAECPYQDFDACPTSVSGELQWNSATVANGTHEVALQVLNAAGNPLIVDQHSLTIANQPIQASGASLNGAEAHAANGTPCSGEEMEVAVNNKRDASVIPYGQPATVKGVLHCGAVPARGAQVAISTVGGPSSAKVDTAVKTADDGSFLYAVPSGPSRKLLFSYTAYSDDPRPSVTAQATIAIRPIIALRIKPRRTTTNGRVIHWKGTIRGGPIPAGGVTLNLEVQEGRRWKIFEQIVTGSKGKFHFGYQFHATTEPTVYKFRVALPKVGSAGYDYAPGASKSVAVHVRP